MIQKENPREQEPMHYLLTDWFLRQGMRIVTYAEIGDEILKIREIFRRPKKKIFHEEVLHWASQVRQRLQSSYEATLWTISGVGYKVANDREYVYFLSTRMSDLYSRAARVQPMLSGMNEKRRAYLPDAYRKYFPKVADGTRAYVREFKRIETNKKEKNGDATKQ